MDGIRKSIRFLVVAGIILQIGLFSELVVDVSAWCLLRGSPDLPLVPVCALWPVVGLRRFGDGLFCATVLLLEPSPCINFGLPLIVLFPGGRPRFFFALFASSAPSFSPWGSDGNVMR